jgi:peptidoglycan/xylan/chitin deacetylase (PgdA/CDA1 family)
MMSVEEGGTVLAPEVWMFHRIRSVGTDEIGCYPAISLPPARFDAFLREKCAAATPITAAEAGAGRPGFAVTFDDGYIDNLTTALPILERHGVPGTIFVATDFVDGRLEPYEETLAQILRDTGVPSQETWNQHRMPLRSGSRASRRRKLAALAARFGVEVPGVGRENFLTWDQVRELDSHPLIEIGLHGRTHALMTRCGPLQLTYEVIGAKRRLESELARPVRVMSYPYGGNHAVVRAAARVAGVDAAFTTRSRAIAPGDRPLALPRLDSARWAEAAEVTGLQREAGRASYAPRLAAAQSEPAREAK